MRGCSKCVDGFVPIKRVPRRDPAKIQSVVLRTPSGIKRGSRPLKTVTSLWRTHCKVTSNGDSLQQDGDDATILENGSLHKRRRISWFDDMQSDVHCATSPSVSDIDSACDTRELENCDVFRLNSQITEDNDNTHEIFNSNICAIHELKNICNMAETILVNEDQRSAHQLQNNVRDIALKASADLLKEIKRYQESHVCTVGQTNGKLVESSTIRTVYQTITRKSNLNWGLTSDWMVSGKRKRGEQNETSRKDCSASEGYGEATQGSFQKILDFLQSNKVTEINRDSSFIDVGSGYGKVVMHTLFATDAKRVLGIELVDSRHCIASEVYADLTSESSDALSEDQKYKLRERCEFLMQDATAFQRIDEFSHIYMFDKVFDSKTMVKMAEVLRNINFKVLISFHKITTWKDNGIGDIHEITHDLTLRTTGKQGFKPYIYTRNR